MAEHSFFSKVGSLVNSSLCKPIKQKPTQLKICWALQGHHKTLYPEEVLESLSVDDPGEVLDNDLQALVLELSGQAPHLLGPLHLRETAHELLCATQHRHHVLHRLQENPTPQTEGGQRSSSLRRRPLKTSCSRLSGGRVG